MSRQVCRYWNSGWCRNGDNCQYAHPGSARPQDRDEGISTSNRFASLGSDSRGNFGRGARPSSPGPSKYNLDASLIKSDMLTDPPIYPLSCYGPSAKAPAQVFGGPDVEISPDELRLRYYEARGSGQDFQYQQWENSLIDAAKARMTKVARDPDEAVRMIVAAENDPNNRIRIMESMLRGTPNPLGRPPGGTAPAFGAPSAPPAFGQPSQTGASGQPLQAGGTTFGQPSKPGGTAFRQPSQLGGRGAFGQPPQLGGRTSFGQPSHPGTGGAFGQPSALGRSAPAFGQSSQPQNPFARPAGSSFGQPSALGGQAPANPFSQPVGEGAAPASGVFASRVPPQPQFDPKNVQPGVDPAFREMLARGRQEQQPQGALGKPSVFGGAQSLHAAQLGGNPFARAASQASSNPFATTQATIASPFAARSEPAVTNPFAKASTGSASTARAATGVFGALRQPAPSPFSPTESTRPSKGPTDAQFNAAGQLASFHGRPVTYLYPATYDPAKSVSLSGELPADQLPVKEPCIKRDDGQWEKIWFPDGMKWRRQQDWPGGGVTREDAGGDQGIKDLEEKLDTFLLSGDWGEGGMPEIPPMREWVKWDF